MSYIYSMLSTMSFDEICIHSTCGNMGSKFTVYSYQQYIELFYIVLKMSTQNIIHDRVQRKP